MPYLHQPNIIVCLFDSLSELHSGFHDDKFALPVFNSLQGKSIRFSRAYTPSPQSSPARASLFTGLDPCVHGLWTNGVRLADNERTFSQRLSQAGYASFLAGRYQLSGVSRWTTEQCRKGEFDQFDWAHGPLHRSRQNGYLNWLKATSPEHYSALFDKQPDPDVTGVTLQQRTRLASLPDELGFNSWVGASTGQWIESIPADRPFVAIAAFSVGDSLGAEPDVHGDAEGVHTHALQQADKAMGQLLDMLEARNRDKDTVLIVTAARGNNTHGHQQAMKESAIRVPLLIVSKELTPQVIDSPVSTLDVAPTVLTFANAPIAQRMQGRSLFDVIGSSDESDAWALSRLRSSASAQATRWQSALCTQSMKLVVQHGCENEFDDNISLYDLESDPAEAENLAQQKVYATQLEHMIDYMIDARCAMEDRTEPRIAEF